jgi:hypothetical protein
MDLRDRQASQDETTSGASAERRGGLMAIIEIPSQSLVDKQSMRVVAEVCGHFALHHTTNYERLFTRRFTVTHIPTGRAVRQFLTEEAARALLRELEASTLDWSLTSAADLTDAHRQFDREVLMNYQPDVPDEL